MAIKYWTDKDGKRFFGSSIVLDDRRIFNPTEEQLLAAGYEAHEEVPYEETTEDVRRRKIAEIEAYDASDAVNDIILDGLHVWLDFDMRQRIRSTITSAESVGRDMTTLWLGELCFTMPIVLAKQLIAMVEVYASDCFNVTAQHKANVAALESKDEIEAYDFTTGYPDKLEINTK